MKSGFFLRSKGQVVFVLAKQELMFGLRLVGTSARGVDSDRE